MPVSGDTEDQRWERARRIAAGQADPAVRRTAKLRVGVVIGVCAFVGMAAVAVAVALAAGSSHPAGQVARRHSSGAQLTVGMICYIGGVGLAAFGLIEALRRLKGQRVLDSPLLALKYSVRRAVRGQVLGKRTARADQLGITRNLARQVIAQQPSPMLYGGLAIAFAGHAIIHPSPFRSVLAVTYLLLAASYIPIARRQRRKAAAFLERNPASTRGVAPA